jgi:hypothetical protein
MSSPTTRNSSLLLLVEGQFGQLICHFLSINTLMGWHSYQLYSVMFGQLHEGLVEIPDQF